MFDAGWHRQMFYDFAIAEIASGGPDPHLRLTEVLARKTEDPAWFVGCYTAPYVVSTAEVIAAHWSRERVLNSPVMFSEWISKNWYRLPIRKERRVNGTGPVKLAEILFKYAQWLSEQSLIWTTDFDEAYARISAVPHHGRYFGMKLYETLRRAVGGLPEFPDIRPKQGSLARRGLALMFPEHNPKDDSSEGLEEANRLSDKLRETITGMDWFTVEVLLCNYRQAFAGRQYPGRAHDSELGHAAIVQDSWSGLQLEMLSMRPKLFPKEHLGEIQGWSDRRLELGKVMTDHNYVWSDMLFDYKRTKDLSQPVGRKI